MGPWLSLRGPAYRRLLGRGGGGVGSHTQSLPSLQKPMNVPEPARQLCLKARRAAGFRCGAVAAYPAASSVRDISLTRAYGRRAYGKHGLGMC